MLLSEKVKYKVCRPMCQICFNHGAESMIYGRRKVLIVDRNLGNFYEETQKNKFKENNVTPKKKHDNTNDKQSKKFYST